MLVAPTGLTTPAPGAPHVEQIGWGVARQVADLLRAQVDEPALELLADVVRLAETPGFLAYAVFEGRTALAVALVSLPGDPADAASYVGDVLAADAPAQSRTALLVRALHDVATAGVGRLETNLPADQLAPLGFVRRDDVEQGSLSSDPGPQAPRKVRR